jgi:magnesium transporter
MNNHNGKNTNHPAESAGHIMVTNVPTIHESATVGDAEQLLLKETKNFAAIDYIYVLDNKKRLAGVIPIKEIFRSPKHIALKSFPTKEMISVRPHTDRERVALLALKHNIKSVPVIDKEDLFLGIVPYDAILGAMHAEGVENILRFGGVSSHGSFDDIFHLPILVSLKHRLPWLILGLLGGIATAAIVGSFEEVLSKNIILAAFIPLIVYMADAVGTQMEAFIIRDLAINPELKLLKYLLRQALIVVLIGLLVSAIMYGISLFLYHDPNISFVLVAALFCAIVSSLITGLIIPYAFEKLHLDPANASGPVATIIQDVLSVIIYFAIASLVLL